MAAHAHAHNEIRHYGILASTTFLFFVVVLIGTLLSGSVTLWGETAHIFIDALGVWVACGAVALHRHRLSQRFRNISFWISVMLFMVPIEMMAGEGLSRLFEGHGEVHGPEMLATAFVGLIASTFLHRFNERIPEGLRDELFLVTHFHFESDIAQYALTLCAAIIISFTEWWWLDADVAIGVAVWMGVRTVHIIQEAGKMAGRKEAEIRRRNL